MNNFFSLVDLLVKFLLNLEFTICKLTFTMISMLSNDAIIYLFLDNDNPNLGGKIGNFTLLPGCWFSFNKSKTVGGVTLAFYTIQ